MTRDGWVMSSTLGRVEDSDDAEREKDHHPPTPACVKCNDLDTAHKLLMKLDGVDECGAGAPAYSTLMLGYARQGRLTEALGLLEQWEKGRGPKDGKFAPAREATSSCEGRGGGPRRTCQSTRDSDMGTEWYPKRTATTRMLFAALRPQRWRQGDSEERVANKRISTWRGA